MKRFLLFTWPEDKPNGGWYDRKGSFDSVEDATEQAAKLKSSYKVTYQVVDTKHDEIVVEDLVSLIP